MIQPGEFATLRPRVWRRVALLGSVAAVWLVGGIAPEVWAQSSTLDHEDRATSLYRVVVSIGASDQPLLPVAVLQGQRQVEIASAAGVRIIGTGDGSVETRVPGDRPVVIRGSGFAPSVRRYYFAVARVPSDKFTKLKRLRDEWRKRGFTVTARAIGTTYALRGRPLDTRQTVLCIDEPLTDPDKARIKADELSEKTRQNVFLHVEVERHPRALLIAASAGAEVRAGDVLWFAATDAAGSLTVTGLGAGGRRKMQLPGRVYVVPDDSGGLTVVNEAPIEKILAGVVASEIFASAPMEALKAQAVAARTDMLAKVGLRHRADPYSICSEVHCQAYGGTGRVSARIEKAVQATRGEVLIDAAGQLVDAFYHAVSGGHTEHNENAWKMEPHPALRGREDLLPGAKDYLTGIPTDAQIEKMLAAPDMSYAAASGRNSKVLRWVAKRTVSDYKPHLLKHGIKQAVKALKVTARGVSGRAKEIELVLADGAVRRIYGELRIRRAFRSLRSSLFVIDVGPRDGRGVPRWFTFRGAGYGHGVGLDQTGSCGRAQKGQDYRAITGHYYSGSKILKLY